MKGTAAIRTMMVFLMVFVILVCVPVNALGCYLDKESAIYCTDVTLNEAIAESEYTEKALDLVYLYSSSCSEIEECQLVICKDSCTMDVRGLCEYGVATKDSCSTGCCQTDQTCTELETEMDCIVQAKYEGTDLYSYTAGACDCGSIVDYELVEKDEVEYVVDNDPLIYYVPEQIPVFDEPENKSVTKLESIDGEPVSFPYVPVALIAVLVFLYFALRGTTQKTVYHKRQNAITVKIPPKSYRPPQPAKRKHYTMPRPVIEKPTTTPRPREPQRPIQSRESLNAIERIRRTEELRAILRRKRN